MRDRGAATILVLAFGLFLTVAGVAAAGVGAARVGRHEARTAADLGALAGAAQAIHGTELACARAGQLVTANRGRMTSCVVEGLEIVVRAEVVVRAVPGLNRHAVATARAGPVQILAPAPEGPAQEGGRLRKGPAQEGGRGGGTGFPAVARAVRTVSSTCTAPGL